jgi:hypothetical protein
VDAKLNDENGRSAPPKQPERAIPEPDPRGERVLLDRRAFLQAVGAGAALALGSEALPAVAAAPSGSVGASRSSAIRRRSQAYRVRVAAAKLAKHRPLVVARANGEETDYPYVANYSKALPHDGLGEVDPGAYRALLDALRSGDPDRFERIPLGLGVKLTAPQTGLAFDLEGPDAGHLAIPPAPRIDGPENSAEMAELYWMALARDVHVADYEVDPITRAAADDLSERFSDFRGPKQAGRVTPQTLFRGSTAGDRVGPYFSQFLWLDVPFGAQRIEQRNQTTLAGVDFLTDYPVWLAAQNGADLFGNEPIDPQPRYLRNLRDLARWVQIDALYQAYLNACLVLLGLRCPVNAGNPLVGSATQAGFGEWGPPHILSLVTEVATRALKAVWRQKWLVHRRLRPEEFGGRIHHHMTGAAVYPIDPEILNSPVLDRVFTRYGTYLLPMAFSEGCPTHPAYGAGHATVAGACVTVLKAWFDGSFVIPEPVVASDDGLALLPYHGPPLTVSGELDKVAANIAIGRNGAGVHWRTDYWESVRLGEEVAIGILEEQKLCHNQEPSFTFTGFDGKTVKI